MVDQGRPGRSAPVAGDRSVTSPEYQAETGRWWARVVVEYDGTDFAGSQFQPNQRTVQGVIEEALQRLTGEWQRIVLAGRTDRGVHASGQVAGFELPARFAPAVVRRGLNALLPRDVAVLTVEPVKAGFHARFSARARRYGYAIWNGPTASPLRRRTCWHVTATLDVAAMQAGGATLIGTHDYASFAGSGRGIPDDEGQTQATIRTVTAVAVKVADELPTGRLIWIEIEAQSFLPQMVRNIVAGLVMIGRGAWPISTMHELLLAADRRRSAPTAPPQGVILLRVDYGPEWQG